MKVTKKAVVINNNLWVKPYEREQVAEIVEFDTIAEFKKYIAETPTSNTYAGARLSSQESSYSFTQTKNFNQAVELLTNGWEDISKRMTQKLDAKKNSVVWEQKQKQVYDVVGFQASVPRFLQNIPTSMINKKSFRSKDKVVTMTKAISYLGNVSVEMIIEESIKALMVVKKIEAQGIRVNLNIMRAHAMKGNTMVLKVRIKNANERLNISKLAFPLAHPSMLRRLAFRFNEVYPNTPASFVSTYGSSLDVTDMRQLMEKGEYLLPNFIRKDVNKIEKLEDLINL